MTGLETLERPAAGDDAAPEGGFAIYVHWPFCQSKCPYCDFNSHVRHAPPDQARFAAAFERELAAFRARTGPLPVGSVFLGGGTPSLMEPATVERILAAIHRLWPVDPAVEITLEANPSSVERSRFAGYRAAGVNRLSLGVQSLVDRDLKSLGRLHDAATARAALATAAAVFENVSCDMIYARPGQDVAAWRAELSELLSRAGAHVSLYQLTIEPGTPFAALHAAGRLATPEPELAADLYEATAEVAAGHGLVPYEISNYARPGFECRHNLVYWRAGSWVGAGPGAHGRLEADGRRVATLAERHPERWLERVEADGHGLVEDEPLDGEAVADEFLVMGLRLAEGLDLARHARLAGRPLPDERVDPLVEDGFLVRPSPGRLAVTARGRLVLDAVLRALSG